MDFIQMSENIASDWSLGAVSRPPRLVSGGYLHKMYRLDTARGSYAVKLLNPGIMQRPEAMQNYRKAEALEAVLEAHQLPVVAAMRRDGQKMQKVGNQYYYLFPWVDAAAVPWKEITTEHCRIIGNMLAQMHTLPCDDAAEAANPAPNQENWVQLAKEASSVFPELSLPENFALLQTAQQAYNNALQAMPSIHAICNADMDCKNVLWQDDRPLVIDLECLEISNPVNDLVQLALSWAGGAVCDLSLEKLEAFLQAYHQRHQLPELDWHSLIGLGFAWLDWFSYNIRRALGCEGASAQDREMGVKQARETLNRIRTHAALQQRAAAVFSKVMNP